MAKDDIYYPPVTYVSERAIVTVHRPILTDEERARRMRILNDAAAAMIREGDRVNEIRRRAAETGMTYEECEAHFQLWHR